MKFFATKFTFYINIYSLKEGKTNTNFLCFDLVFKFCWSIFLDELSSYDQMMNVINFSLMLKF